MCGAKVVQPRSSLTPVTAHFLFPVIVVSLLCWCSLLLLLFLLYRAEQWAAAEVWREVWDWWKDREKKVAENQRGSTYVKTAQRHSERQRKQPAHVREADGVSV